MGALSMDGDHKAMKLVRFTSEDGASAMIKDGGNETKFNEDARNFEPPRSVDVRTEKFRSGSDASSSSTSSAVSVSNHDGRSVRKVFKSSPVVPSSNPAASPRGQVSSAANPLWRAVLCFSPVHTDQDDNGDYFLTGNAGDDESLMSCGDHYQSSVYDSYCSDDDENEEEVEGESSASDDGSSNSCESSEDSSGSEDAASDADSCEE